MTRLTAQEIEAIRKRAEKASDGDWYSEVSTFENTTEKLTEIAVQPGVAMSVRTEADAEFIANAREDIPFRIKEVEEMKNGIDHVIFLLANENIENSRIVSEIHCELIRVYNGDKIEPHPFNTEWRL